MVDSEMHGSHKAYSRVGLPNDPLDPGKGMDARFWDGVTRRAERIRNLRAGELPRSEELAGDRGEVGMDAQFWDGVARRAERIRNLRAGELPRRDQQEGAMDGDVSALNDDDELDRIISVDEILSPKPPSLHGRLVMARSEPDGWVGPATPAGILMVVVAVGCALAATDAGMAAAKGGRAIPILHVLGTSAFAAVFLIRPWSLRPLWLAPPSLLLGASTGLEFASANYPQAAVQHTIRFGCGVVAVSMLALLWFALRASYTRKGVYRKKGFYLFGVFAGAAGSLVISVGAFLAAEAAYGLDQFAAFTSTVLAVGTFGLGWTCLGLHSLTIVPWRGFWRWLAERGPSQRARKGAVVSLPVLGPIESLKRHGQTAARWVGLEDPVRPPGRRSAA